MRTKHLTTIGGVATTLLLTHSAFAQTDIGLWYHGAGNEVESALIQQLVDDFNGKQSDWNVVVETFHRVRITIVSLLAH